MVKGTSCKMYEPTCPTPPSTERPPIDDRMVAILAKRASVDRRSFVRRLAGLPVKGLAGERIDKVLARFLASHRAT